MYSLLHINIRIMKHIQKIIALLVLLGIFHISYGEDMKVQEVKVLDANTLSVTLSENPNLDVGEVKGELTILNDVSLRGAVLAEGEEAVVELMLEEALQAETSYSLLTISGTDGSIEFTTPKDVEGFVATNTITGDAQNIVSLEVLDNKTLKIRYHQNIASHSYEYKLLAESKVLKIEKPDYFVPELIVSLEPPLTSNTNYILMFIEMQDVDGNFLEFDTGIYDFMTQEIAPREEIDEALMLSETQVAPEKTPVDLTSAPEEDSHTLNTVNVAKNMQETPDTGAQTWMLILATLVINTFYYLSRKKKTLFA